MDEIDRLRDRGFHDRMDDLEPDSHHLPVYTSQILLGPWNRGRPLYQRQRFLFLDWPDQYDRHGLGSAFTAANNMAPACVHDEEAWVGILFHIRCIVGQASALIDRTADKHVQCLRFQHHTSCGIARDQEE